MKAWLLISSAFAFSLLQKADAKENIRPASQVDVQVDWPKFMARNDMIWDRMPTDYYEGPFVGNGLLGTIIFKDDQQPNTLRFEIGRVDVYDHRAKGAHAVGRLPIGQLLLTPIGTIQKTNLRIDLWNAEIRGEITTSAGIIKLRCYVPSGETLIVLDIEGTGAEKNAKCTFRPEQGNHPRPTVQPGRDKGVIYQPNPPFLVEHRGEIEVTTQPLLVGDDYATAWSDRKNLNGTRTVFVTVANRWAKKLQPATGSADDAVATIKDAQTRDLAALELQHREWWHRFYPASFVSIPDASKESFYWIQLYKLASATREDQPPIDLMGPWFRKSVWAAYWTNLNIQLAYYTTGITNHRELAEPLYQLIERSRDQLAANVSPAEYRSDCSALGNPVGFDVLNANVDLKIDPANPNSRLKLIALPWLMQLFYIHNQIAIDDTRLRESIYPLMKRTFQVYVRTFVRDADSKYRIPYSYSDEYGNTEETSLNIAMARWGFETLIATAVRLKIDDPQLPQWKEILDNMADYNIDDTGIMIGKNMPFAKPHRHYSHLFGIFPFYSLNIGRNPERLPLMEKSIRHFTDLDGDNCMFKFNGASSLWASVGHGDEALKWLDRSLEILLPRKVPSVGPNTLYSENDWPTFESPIASSRSILDMLLQSWGGKIRVFPACPSAWKEAVFHQLRAEGGFLVSAKREFGKTIWIALRSEAGEQCALKVPDWNGPLETLEGSAARVTALGANEYRVELKRGEEIVIFPQGHVVFPEVRPIAFRKTGIAPWGIHSTTP